MSVGGREAFSGTQASFFEVTRHRRLDKVIPCPLTVGILLSALAAFGRAQGMQVRPEQAEKFSDLELVNLLAVSLPFHPAEKQALLEAKGCAERARMLVALLQMDAHGMAPEGRPS